MTNTILAIDLGKFNSVLCHFDADTREASFRTVYPRVLCPQFQQTVGKVKLSRRAPIPA